MTADCDVCNGSGTYWNGLLQEHRPCVNGCKPAPETEAASPLTIIMCPPEHIFTCDHDFKGWRPFQDGRGGETVCTKCGMGAMAWSLRTGL